MKTRANIHRVSTLKAWVMFAISCSLAFLPLTAQALQPRRATTRDSRPVEIPVVVVPEHMKAIPEGSRIVITNISGPCSEEVKDALVRRLTYNAKYDVITRDNLDQVLYEKELVWRAGDFNTKTAAKLGELLGASLFIVGRVSLCGVPAGRSTNDEYHLLAALQIIDLETGRVLLSSANEGHYMPNEAASANWEITGRYVPEVPSSQNIVEAPVVSVEPIKPRPRWKRAANRIANLTKGRLAEAAEAAIPFPSRTGRSQSLMDIARTGLVDAIDSAVSEPEPVPKDTQWQERRAQPGTGKANKADSPLHFPALRAAERIASRFADRFFARPSWETVEMWASPGRLHSGSLDRVRLGRCPDAVQFIEQVAAGELDELSARPRELAKYLHNYGVALLCAGDLDRANKKLRSAYRIDDQPATARMLAFASKLSEWSLKVEVDQEPEIDLLFDAHTATTSGE